MSEADFIFDEGEWLKPEAERRHREGRRRDRDSEGGRGHRRHGPEERHRLLQAKYPEFDLLVDEFEELQPPPRGIQEQRRRKPTRLFWTLSSTGSWPHCVLRPLPATLRSSPRLLETWRALSRPSTSCNLRDHEIMVTLMECRETWMRVQSLRPAKPAARGMLSPPEDDDEEMEGIEDEAVVPKKTKETAAAKAARKAAADKAKRAKKVEASLADLSQLLGDTKTLQAQIQIQRRRQRVPLRAMKTPTLARRIF